MKMANDTGIHWTDDTVNPTTGCDGCELWTPTNRVCYAGILHEQKGATNIGFSPVFNILQPHPGRMAEAAARPGLRGRVRDDGPWKNGLPRLIFISSNSDSLSTDISFDYLYAEIITHVTSPQGRRHVWQWLTKRPKRMAEFARWLEGLGVTWPPNLWAGTSVTTTDTLSRVTQLLEVPAAVRFLSVEPQLEDLDMSRHLDGIHWVIQGGGSGTGATRFDVEWADRMRGQCQEAGVPYFLKQLGSVAFENGERLRLRHPHGSDWSEWAERLKVREFPDV